MKTLDRHVGGQLLAALFKTLFALMALVVLIDLITERWQAAGARDVPWTVIGQYYLALMPRVAYRTAPFAFLIAVLLIVGGAAQRNEVTAALAGGVSLRRFVRVPVLMALAASVGVFALNESAGAPANALAQDIDDAYFSSRRATDRPGVTWANLGGGWTAHVEKFNRTALTGEGVRMHAIGPERVEEILARRIYWAPEEEAWLLEDGVRHVYEPEADRRAAGQRITQQRAPFDATPQELFAFEDRLREKRAWELARDIRRAAARNVPVTGYWVSYHERFAWPAVTAVVAVLAIPFALRLRRGGVALSFGFGVGLTITHVTLYYVFVGLGHLGVLPPMAAAWAGNVLFLAVGVVLFVKTPT